MEEECDHGSLPSSCPVCLGPAPKPPPPRRQAVFVARFDGHCPSCNLPIVVGQMAAKWTDDRTRHQGCQP